MKNVMKSIQRMSVLLLAILFLPACSDSDTEDVVVALDQVEIDDLKFLREEEKLARDVYLYSYDKYNLNVFSNISNSEQTHMDKVLSLLTKYGIADPASTERGVFNNAVLQDLYDQLTQKADSSLVDALTVGAIIEDLDISDIDDFFVNTTKSDLLEMYSNLLCGSRNHMRSYSSQLTANGATYQVQFITEEEYATIMNQANEKCGK